MQSREDSYRLATASAFGHARLESCWPTARLGRADVVPGECMGRFAATGESWKFEGTNPGDSVSGNGDPLENLAQAFRSICAIAPNAGMIGYLAYEFGYDLLDLPVPFQTVPGIRVPECQFLFFDNLDFPAARSFDSDALRKPRSYARDELMSLIGNPRVRAFTSWRQYEESVRKIKAHIRAGDIYQANLTQAFDVQTQREGPEIYEALKQINPAPFSAYLRFEPVRIGSTSFPAIEILSSSPERFWRKDRRHIETRPIKGTIGRGGSRLEDKERLRKLLTSAKDHAELLMITDLLRNDVGRCADIGSVHAPILRRARACASVWHLESVVTGRVADQTGWEDVMRSLFPGGSVTGAPKRRAAEILSRLENVPRGVYCGAIGWVDAAGDCDFALPIRTTVKSGALVRIHGGGGIVADSDAESEYEESLVKIAPILECLCGADETENRGRTYHACEGS